ncbi:uncharacterized protein MONBRDRAFT_10765 [Monosiga brevicollis MX1]|uniref:N-acetyltransferase domain-containing protein n=1 Tax=Monosiga brevicollis TaxID=81824 RepID=A9V762_MONBE|nr:uncharacterized protein MONBRDRAFT_10765 [Monosiga brevicollis MX1]EDQ86664.1 predicted protein [Monosiga brevicollis MX1]|eukprot:XP_001748500.1 hypothetical protein [Monosiga brevicollis MX1]
MRINNNDALTSEGLVLVPYMAHHVPKYHEWMQSTELQEQPAHGMCTNGRSATTRLDDPSPDVTVEEETAAMVGDVNLFFNDQDDPHSAEIERVTAKIGFANAPSLHLFTERLGFTEVSRSVVFEEVTLERRLEPALVAEWRALVQSRKLAYDTAFVAARA